MVGLMEGLHKRRKEERQREEMEKEVKKEAERKLTDGVGREGGIQHGIVIGDYSDSIVKLARGWKGKRL